ncbi:IS66 family transposase [Legionella longbeachae]|uniref:IS66 family transposase n=1 Tax=Legionella longbeachae TaxID=450 RepID=UPI00399D1783
MPKVKKLSQEQMDNFLAAIMNSNIGAENAEFAKMLIHGNAWMARQLELGQLSIAKLRKLFQIQGSEKGSSRKPKHDPSSSNHKGPSEEDTKGHGRNSADAYQGAVIVDVEHPELNPGDTCPAEACGGRLYEMSEPGIFVHVTGAPLASATRYNMQKLRCAICEIIYTAPLPKSVGDKKYDANFIAMLMINKYFMSIPLYRQDRLQNHLGIPLPASTQWDLMVAHEPMLKALYKALVQDAANGLALCYDDTSVKIMSEIKAAKLAEKGKKSQHTCFTTGIVSLHENHRSYLYITDNRTAGKCIAEIMALRDADLEPPIMMCDALPANIPQGISQDLYILCFCLVHARRQFYELPNGYDDVADKVIGLIGTLYDHEAHTKGYSPEKRLAYHQEKSTPVMEELNAYLQEQKLAFEPNSVPGKAIDYMLSRWTQLSQFLRQLHAPLDTNIVERALKLVIQVRKSSMFYKTLSSAAFASYVQSALYSAAQNEINPCEYMAALIEHENAVITNPSSWLPWHYKETLKQNLAMRAKQDALTQADPD